MTMLAITVRSVAVALTLLLVASPARAEDVKVFSSVAMRTVVEELAQRFERETRHRVVPTFGLAGALKTRIEGGEAYDLAILTPAQIDDLIKQGKAAAASRAVIARTGLGLMVRAGGPKLDVATVDAFKKTLLAAKSLTYVPAGASGIAFIATVKQLGIAPQLEAKTKAAASGDEVNANVTSGAAEIAVLPVSEILPVKGAALGGVFPADVQTYIVMAGATSNAASQAARDFLARLTAPANDAVIKAKGMERVSAGQAAAASSDSLAARVQTLEDRDAIRALLVSYASTLDSRDFDGFAQLWARDAEFIGGASDRATGPTAIRDLLQGLLKVNAAPVPGRDFHLVMNQTVDVTGDTASGFSRGTWVVTDPDKKLRISIIANYYDQFVREGGRWKFKRHQIGGAAPVAN